MSSFEKARFSDATTYYGKNNNPLGYQVEAWHDGLNEHKVIKDKDFDILKSKLESQLLKWDEKWQRQKAKQQEAERRQRGKESAEKMTQDAQSDLYAAENILSSTLNVDDSVDWYQLKRHEPFIFQPSLSTDGIKFSGQDNRPHDIVKLDRRRKPHRTDSTIAPKKSFWSKLIPPLSKKREAEADERLQTALANWEASEKEAYRIEEDRSRHLRDLQAEYKEAKTQYERQCADHSARVDDLRQRWINGDKDAAEEHAELVLNASQYPDWIHQDFEVAYDPTNQIVVVDYALPSIDRMPTLKEVSFVASRDEYREKHTSEAQKKKLYDSVLYQIALRTIHELFEADEADVIAMVTFNGWITNVNPGTGKTETKCILSVQTLKADFEDIDLSQVEPKACFKGLKGIAASSLSEMAPVSPIMQFDSDDSRFVESREVASGLGLESNLAAMDWEDFEHLVRELFAKQFEKEGGDVHVTQSSRDAGVDAIAFDPDPVRGGKFVIQAKRYTNTVGVSAVRDLYGTVVNEGAVKGILITTSDYGPDAYEFAKDKPLSLLSGSNLLQMLQEHGYKATIDIPEAKRVAQGAE